MKIFISYKFTDINRCVLDNKLIPFIDFLRKNTGHDIFCSYEKENYYQCKRMDKKAILKHSLENLDNSNIFLLFTECGIGEENYIELGYALAKNLRIVILRKRFIELNYCLLTATDIIEYNDLNEIPNNILLKLNFN